MKNKKNWIGNWIIITSILHTLFAVFMFIDTWSVIFNQGLFADITVNSEIGGVLFFFFYGLLLFIFGLTIRTLENSNIILPKIIGYGLLGCTVIALLFVPLSGFWLLLPPAFAILKRKKL